MCEKSLEILYNSTDLKITWSFYNIPFIRWRRNEDGHQLVWYSVSLFVYSLIVIIADVRQSFDSVVEVPVKGCKQEAKQHELYGFIIRFLNTSSVVNNCPILSYPILFYPFLFCEQNWTLSNFTVWYISGVSFKILRKFPPPRSHLASILPYLNGWCWLFPCLNWLTKISLFFLQLNSHPIHLNWQSKWRSWSSTLWDMWTSEWSFPALISLYLFIANSSRKVIRIKTYHYK